MKLDNEFEVPRPVDETWAVLTDLERIAPCMPGAQLTEVEGDTYHGTVKVKVGPMVAQYKGEARFKEKDDAEHKAVLAAKGKERTGKGLASALVTASLASQGANSTKVSVSTDLTISGPLAQFGRGAITEVSSKLLGQFSENLRKMLESVDSAGAATPSANGGAITTPASANGAGAGASATGSVAAPATASPPSAPSGAAGSAAPAPGGAAGSAASAPSAPSSPTAPAATSPELAAPGSQVATAPANRRVVQSPEAEPVDLMSVAGSTILKRLVPLVIGVAVIAALVVWLVRRGGNG